MLKKLSGSILALIGLTVIFASCKKEYESIQSIDSKKISDYIAKNNLTAMVEDPAKTGYYYQIVTPGTGALLKNTDSILYNGSVKSMENATVYLSTPTYANLGTFVGYTNVLNSISIPAIREVLLKMSRGGTARILLPSYLAYGRNGLNDIPSNENIDLTISTYPEANQALLDERLIKEFIASKGLTGMVRDPSGVYYVVTAPGSGTYPITETATVTASYTGRLTDGTVFDSNTSYSSVLNQNIQGWYKSLPGKVREGGKIRILIPSGLGYGTTGSGTISPNAILDFDIEITTVTQ